MIDKEMEEDEDILEDEDFSSKENEKTKTGTQRPRPRLFFSSSLPAIVDEATKVCPPKHGAILVPNVFLKRVLYKDERIKDHLDYLTVVYSQQELHSLQVCDFAAIHNCDSYLVGSLVTIMNLNGAEQEQISDNLLRKDSNRELCRKCKEKDRTRKLVPYGIETGMIESVPQFNADGSPILDDEENQLYLDFPELKCEKGHRWFQGEGQRRDIRGPNPILFESHLYNRKRREIYVEAGTPDPAFTMDRKGRPTQGMYNRSHPEGRKINTRSQRARNGASYYR